MAQTALHGAAAPCADLRALSSDLTQSAFDAADEVTRRQQAYGAHTAIPTQGAASLRVADQAEQLRDTLDAFVALEQLITPAGREDSETLAPTRTQMGALLRVLNDELARQINALASATEALRHAGKGE